MRPNGPQIQQVQGQRVGNVEFILNAWVGFGLPWARPLLLLNPSEEGGSNELGKPYEVAFPELRRQPRLVCFAGHADVR
jgi:hypothetical protein